MLIGHAIHIKKALKHLQRNLFQSNVKIYLTYLQWNHYGIICYKKLKFKKLIGTFFSCQIIENYFHTIGGNKQIFWYKNWLTLK
jgi:hypothetical protein